jgi:phosphatidylserine/phosphatidylglycerophosphate/cardiolipin synthase-like enzyme
MKAAICDVEPTLGSDHPFRLECKRRLAVYYEKNGQKELMEELYWDVLRGRIRMLGKGHPYTRGAKDDLIKLLKEQGHWEQDGSTQWKIDDLLNSTSQASSPHEAY